jgi:hypothetical protein
MKRIILVLVLALALAAPAAIPAAAAELAGVTMAPTTKAGEDTLNLNGMALRKKFFIKVYVGGLYLPAKQSDAAKVLAADTGRKMVMHFLYGVSKQQMCDGWSEGLTANTPNASAALKGKFERLCGLMVDTEKGDRFEFTYVPGTGTTVAFKGSDKGTIEGKDFADALLSCWIGPNPDPGTAFREALLGQ